VNLAYVAPFGFQPKNTTARRVMPMARAVAARGHQVRILVPPYDDPESFGRQWNDAGVEVHSLPRPRGMDLPVVGVPVASGPLNGVDALLAIVQMPPGIPVATVGVNRADNAGLLALQILALGDPDLAAALKGYRGGMGERVAAADERVRQDAVTLQE